MPAPHPLVAQVTARRLRLGVRQGAAAVAVGVGAAIVGTWEAGRADPTLANMTAYARTVCLLVAVVDPVARETLSSDPATLISAAAAHRKTMGLLRGDVAKRMGATGQHIWHIETGGKTRLPTAENYVNAVGLQLVLIFDRPRCCRCDPYWCRTDESGEHCMDQSCGRCIHGCPAPEGECCPAIEGARVAS